VRYRVSEAKVAWRIADREAVLLHADTSAYFGLNATGTLLWNELARRSVSSEQLVAWARRRLSNPPDGLPGDVTAFLEQLEQHDLLDRMEDGAGTEPVAAESAGVAEPGELEYQPPELLRFGELEKLILSGE
jgi:coenzyme PQQ synthesis protein D (PqqD)